MNSSSPVIDENPFKILSRSPLEVPDWDLSLVSHMRDYIYLAASPKSTEWIRQRLRLNIGQGASRLIELVAQSQSCKALVRIVCVLARRDHLKPLPWRYMSYLSNLRYSYTPSFSWRSSPVLAVSTALRVLLVAAGIALSLTKELNLACNFRQH